MRWLLGYEGIPRMARPTFRYDLLSTLFASLATGVMLPALTSQFASEDMSTSIWVVGLLFAERSLGNLLATFFAQDLARRPRVPMVVMARIGIAAFMVCIAALPTGQSGIAGSFAALLIVPYLLAALCINLQSVARHSNYPVNVRGRIFSRLTVIQMASMALSVILASQALDHLSTGHALAYLVSAGLMLIAAWCYSKIRIRRERAMLRIDHHRPVSLLEGFRVLKTDRTFAQYMFWQMIFGAANMVTLPALTAVMLGYVAHYQASGFGFGYGWSMACRVVTPLVVVVGAAPLAGKLFDKVKITRFRAAGACMWGTSKLLVFVAAAAMYSLPAADGQLFLGPLALLFVAFAVQGMGMAVGNIAYNLGHMNFTSPERGQHYMGIHLTLQGIRGVAAPMLGAWLYTLVGINVLPAAGIVIFGAAAGFLLMKPPDDPQALAEKAASRYAFDGPGDRV